MHIHEHTIKPFLSRLYVQITFGVLVCAVLIGFIGTRFLSYINTAPTDFPTHTDIVINEGLNQSDITELLQEKHIVRSSFYVYILLTHSFKNSFVQAGSYQFEKPLSAQEVVAALTQGMHRSPLIKVTFPEGFTVHAFKDFLPEQFDSVSTTHLTQYEGYLFPDTYFIASDTRLDDLVELLQKTFKEKIALYEGKIATSGLSESEVITLASIIEREAKDAESKKMISGILQNRLHINMPLQVDACFDYVLNKTSDELTAEDLTIDSPYNTYTHTGLPPTPIANPGLESIEAVLEPKETDYLYYLTGTDGTFHYAKTFEEHKKNKTRYLE